VQDVDVRPNRIDIDTGAVFGGALTCLVLEGGEKALLTDAGLTALPEPGASAPAAETGGVLRRVLRGRLPLRFGRRN